MLREKYDPKPDIGHIFELVLLIIKVSKVRPYRNERYGPNHAVGMRMTRISGIDKKYGLTYMDSSMDWVKSLKPGDRIFGFVEVKGIDEDVLVVKTRSKKDGWDIQKGYMKKKDIIKGHLDLIGIKIPDKV